MSALDPVVYRGSYIPFPEATPAITVNPLGSPDASLCWADAWTPAILGCLKALTRPETWSGSDLDIAEAMTWAENLIGSIADGCGSSFAFSCVGDFTSSAVPFGVITIYGPEPLGTYVSSSGYEATCAVLGGGPYTYCGVELDVTLSSPFTPSNVQLEYDITLGSVDTPADFQSGVYDLANHHFIGTPVLFSGATPIGHVVYNSGSSPDPTDHLLFFARCARWTTVMPPIVGELFLRDFAISGTATSNPCA